MATRPALPYFADPDTLPAPLPTVEEILTGTRISAPYEAVVVRVRSTLQLSMRRDLHFFRRAKICSS
jgi:hypothetical protein